MGLELSQIFIIFCLSLSCSAFSILNQSACPSPKLSKHVKIAKIIKPSVYGEKFPEGAIIKFACDEGYTLFGPSNTSCKYGDWHDEGPECLLEVAKGSPCHMSSQPDEYASAHLSTDGDPQSCVSFASNESHLLWSVDTFQAHSIRVVTVLTQFSLPNSTVEIRVGSHHPATGAKFNSLCTRQEVTSSQKREHEFLCDQGPINGRYVSISLVEPGTHHVSFCEVRVYSDSGLSIQDSCPDQILSNKTARFVFENQCVQFIGEQTHSEAVEACQQRKGTVVRPYSRAFQNFLDFNVYQYVETALDQVSISYWIDAERLSKTNDWEFGDGSKIQKVQIRDDAAEQCLVSEMRNWHSEGCDNQHQVICVSAPASCGTPGVPEFSSKWDRSKLAVDDVMEFACEIGTSEFFANIKCFPNGTLSEEPSCVPTSNDDFVESLNFMAKLRRCLRSMTMFANFSTWALNVLAAALGILSATVLCAIIACGFRVLKRYRESKLYQFQIADI